MPDDKIDQINCLAKQHKANLGLIFTERNLNVEEELEESAEEYDADMQDDEEYDQNDEDGMCLNQFHYSDVTDQDLWSDLDDDKYHGEGLGDAAENGLMECTNQMYNIQEDQWTENMPDEVNDEGLVADVKGRYLEVLRMLRMTTWA